MYDAVVATILRHKQTLLDTLPDYVQLIKPRIILLLLITTAGAMWIASEGQIDPMQLLIVLAGGTCAAGAANTLNMVYDQDIDLMMERTQHRPLPSQRMQPHTAILFALVLAAIAFALLTWFVNLLSACLAISGILVYMLIYTHLLKRHHPQNIVIGGAAGAIPPLVGWAAVTGHLNWTAWVLFLIVFLWTPPHFWALALMIKEDYAKVNVPMLPVVKGEAVTTRQIFYYALVLVPCTLLLVYPCHVMGWLYGSAAIGLGAVLIRQSWLLMQVPTDLKMARSVFKYSIFYMMLLCAAMVVDSLPLIHPWVSLPITWLPV